VRSIRIEGVPVQSRVMPLPRELSFKSGAKYTVGQAFSSYTSTEREQLRQLLVSPDIFVSVSASFCMKYLDIYTSDSYVYVLPSTEGNINVANQWHNSPLAFWQTQLNFATWCAATGCGVSVHDHLRGHYDFAPDSRNLSQLIFRFHVYYQTRKILRQISAPLPTDEAWNRYNNTYNHTAYQTVCNEFEGDPKSDWRLNRGTEWLARGPGSIFTRFGPKLQSYLRQSVSEAENGFVYSMLDQTKGFTHAGIERLNDSIRTYVWAILGSLLRVTSALRF